MTLHSFSHLYSPLSEALQKLDALSDAAETHGILCGLLCLSPHPQADWERYYQRFLRYVLDDTNRLKADPRCQHLLQALQDYTESQLRSDELTFSLLLPDDHLPLVERVQALMNWCTGFLFGLHLEQLFATTQLDADMQAFLNDISAISQLALPSQDDNSDEADYMHVLEYVRMGVLTLYQQRYYQNPQNQSQME
jgi:uncharacterized protein